MDCTTACPADPRFWLWISQGFPQGRYPRIIGHYRRLLTGGKTGPEPDYENAWVLSFTFGEASKSPGTSVSTQHVQVMVGTCV